MANRDALLERYLRVRSTTEALAEPLTGEDQQLQSMPNASPTKWHRAHTTWFFETFLLAPAGIAPDDPRFGFLFNSYYDAVGERLARPKRGMLSRPTTQEVSSYRRVVDGRVAELLRSLDDPRLAVVAPIVELGLAHEEQHQELILTDILHAFSENPCGPVYRGGAVGAVAGVTDADARWRTFAGGVVEVGAADDGFSFDNERPRHKVFLRDYRLASRPISVGDVKAFVDGRGYDTPSLWLTQGYDTARAGGWRAPQYWRSDDGELRVFTLRGWHAPRDDEPASHLSFWEAEAIARFLDARLPTEAEWEHAASTEPADVGNFADGPLVPQGLGSCAAPTGPRQLFGDVWEWTRSAYDPYPGYAATEGALGEYNAKFMAQQMVLRGGSCFTPRGHARASYRNFWHPDTRFQMAGARLAQDV